MTHDFDQLPPARIGAEVFNRGRDVNGNPTAHYRLFWSNEKTGADRESGGLNTKRREQVGYCNDSSVGAIGLAMARFPGTQWDLAPETLHNARGDWESFEIVRDYDAEAVPVIFRAEHIPESKRSHMGATLTDPARVEVTAVFPTLPGTDWGDVTIYAHCGQHGTGVRGWYQRTRPATEAEADALKRELRGIGYRLQTVKRWTAQHDAKRAATYHASREAV